MAVTQPSMPPEELLDPLETPLQRVQLSLTYRVALLVVAGAMVLLPLAYLAVIACRETNRTIV